MKKIITITAILISLIYLLNLPGVAFGNGTKYSAVVPPPASQTPETLPTQSVMSVVEVALKWLWTILLIGAAVMIVISAYFFLTSAGNPEAVGKARSLILYAIIAIIVAGLAYGIVGIARKIASGQG